MQAPFCEQRRMRQLEHPQRSSQLLSISSASRRGLRLRFGRFSVDCNRHVLYEGDTRLDVKPKAVALLVFLIQNRDRVVDKQELIEQLWPDRFVTEANLTQHVFTLRKAFGESAEAP